MKLIYSLYFSIKEFSLQHAISRIEKDLLKLKSKILSGDYQAALQAREKLAELETLNIEYINS